MMTRVLTVRASISTPHRFITQPMAVIARVGKRMSSI